MRRHLAGIAAAAFGAVFGVAGPAAAQSAYGCTDLDDGGFASAHEGTGGVFYRIQPDLDAFHNISEQAVEDVAELSEALAAQGTTLVFVPVPTKALGMPGALGPGALDYGFDIDIATTVYTDAVRRLREAGVVTADARAQLIQSQVPTFLATDRRLTTEGTRRVAQAVAMALREVPELADLPRNVYTSAPRGAVPVVSTDHARIQRACLSDLPRPEVIAMDTILSQRAAGSSNTDTSLFGGATTGGVRLARIASVGSSMTSIPEANFAGFVAEFTGIETQHYAVPRGGAFAAISSYLTSTAFQTARPAVLVWEVPIEANLAQFGDQPMAELVAAAQGPAACRTPLTAFTAGNGDIRVDLGPLIPGETYTLYLDAGEVPATEARFTFTSRAGLTRTRTVVRHDAQQPTGRFYLPMTGLWREGAAHVDIRTDQGFGGTPRVIACLSQEGA